MCTLAISQNYTPKLAYVFLIEGMKPLFSPGGGKFYGRSNSLQKNISSNYVSWKIGFPQETICLNEIALVQSSAHYVKTKGRL